MKATPAEKGLDYRAESTAVIAYGIDNDRFCSVGFFCFFCSFRFRFGFRFRFRVRFVSVRVRFSSFWVILVWLSGGGGTPTYGGDACAAQRG